MNQLGHRWYPQTVGLVERHDRPLDVADLAALALCLETTVDALVLAAPNVQLVAFGDHVAPTRPSS
jgi:hypothetical protein